MASRETRASVRSISGPSGAGLLRDILPEFLDTELEIEAEKYQNHRISRPMPGYVTQTLMARRALFGAVGLFDSALGHGDSTDWFLRASERGTVMELLPEVLTYRRLHPNNRSRVRADKSRDEYLRLLKLSLDRKRHLNRSV